VKEMPLKAWVLAEAERCGVKATSIYARFHDGRYSGLQIRRVNKRVVFVSGHGNYAPAQRKDVYDWSGVDWSQPGREIARRLGCGESTVRYARQRIFNQRGQGERT
jgi:hypothetical protein